MALPKLPLPQSPSATVYSMIVQRLKDDPDLKRVVNTWVVLDGESRLETLPASTRDLPWVKVDTMTSEAHPVTEGQTWNPITYRFSYVVDGTNQADADNLWYAIQRCLFPGDGSVMRLKNTLMGDSQAAWTREYLQHAGSGVEIVDGSQTLKGVGVLQVQRFTNTAL